MMPGESLIAEAIRRRIEQELGTIEHEHDVRILLAIESGSRAWGFPSADSDYDVRFIYAHRMESYLAIEHTRDVIERPIDSALDINGWDLRKALRLMVYSNAILFEWFTSPIRYREVETESAKIRLLAEESCFLPAYIYHYDRMARRFFDEIAASSDVVLFKTYCYALRPSLALHWIRRYEQPPPMNLAALLSRDMVAGEVREAIRELIKRKTMETEGATCRRIPELDNFIAGTLSEIASRPSLPDRTQALANANVLFASLVRNDIE